MSVVPGPASQDAVFKLVYASPALQCSVRLDQTPNQSIGWWSFAVISHLTFMLYDIIHYVTVTSCDTCTSHTFYVFWRLMWHWHSVMLTFCGMLCDVTLNVVACTLCSVTLYSCTSAAIKGIWHKIYYVCFLCWSLILNLTLTFTFGDHLFLGNYGVIMNKIVPSLKGKLTGKFFHSIYKDSAACPPPPTHWRSLSC